ncbi:hypothetical protein F0223_21350 [Vibrio coralliilyticus]|uniref:DUF3693 domain-containing protein n=1 Tax=Vibrio coralliilyticus TaxID=190893 RepID=UPI00148E4619|nr:DUF3693 domain-containing protein [Vibrio coralliilyticus]NOI20773.1 hypothetical protein [Vibrio coralliilyticus]
MYTNNLIEAYKEHMKYVQYKQIAHELGISPQMLTEVRKGRTYLKENQILMMAEAVGEDKEKALIGLAADKAKTFESQALWSSIAKKFDGLGLRNISLAVSGLAVVFANEIGVKAQFALLRLMFN